MEKGQEQRSIAPKKNGENHLVRRILTNYFVIFPLFNSKDAAEGTIKNKTKANSVQLGPLLKS